MAAQQATCIASQLTGLHMASATMSESSAPVPAHCIAPVCTQVQEECAWGVTNLLASVRAAEKVGADTVSRG
jgi:hypothetical protein